MKRIVRIIGKLIVTFALLGIPFVISAAFSFTSWMGWPALISGGLIWLFTIIALTNAITKDEKDKERKAEKEHKDYMMTLTGARPDQQP